VRSAPPCYGPVVSPGRAFGAHVDGPGQAHLAASRAAVPFGITDTAAGPAWPLPC
jgi:hypothetical protein